LDPYFTGVAENELIPLAVEQAFPNPFNESTVFSFKLGYPTKLNLCVYDILGNKVATFIDNSLVQPGKFIYKLEPAKYNLPAGVYYFSLTGNGINKQSKIVYCK
jgi:hypothetical protein